MTITIEELKDLCLQVGLDEHDAEVFSRMPECGEIVDALMTLVAWRITKKLTDRPSPEQ